MAEAGETVTGRDRFMQAYRRLKDEILSDPAFEHTEESRRWVEEMMDYNVPKGKLNRGFAVVETYLLLREGSEIGEEDFFLACVLGWCVEWLQACLLVLDDIMDNSHTRRGQLCWYKLPKVGLQAINDGILLKCHIHKMVKRYFRGKTFYEDLLELCDEIGIQTSLGQMLDLIVTHEGEKDLSRYKMPVYRSIVQYKTSYYSFYLPIACALLLAGEKLDCFVELKNILVEMGIYFQIQDDYLDCFGDPEVIGKIGTDIEDYKCSWLVVKALELANDNQIKVLYESYGKLDPVCVAKVKKIFKELDLESVFFEYEITSYNCLMSSIEAQQNPAIREILGCFLKKIYQRQK